jgi:DNA end-binding protein Ku
MASRPNWKGYMKLSLVSCPVALYTATSTSERASFHMLNRETGNRLRRQMVDSESGDVIEDADQVKGYEVGKDDYVVLEADELDAVALESTHTIDIDSFVPRSQIDELYIDTPYYLVPDDKIGEEAFAVIRDAMKAKGVVGLARIVLYRREHILMLEPRGRGLLATTLRYGYEVRPEDDYIAAIPKTDIPKEMLELAKHIIETKARKFDVTKFEDRYENALTALVKAKRAGKMPKAGAAPPKPSNVVNLMDALRRSVSGNTRAATTPQASVKSRKAPSKKRKAG